MYDSYIIATVHFTKSNLSFIRKRKPSQSNTDKEKAGMKILKI